jgi:hypothetical protein
MTNKSMIGWVEVAGDVLYDRFSSDYVNFMWSITEQENDIFSLFFNVLAGLRQLTRTLRHCRLAVL